MCKEFGWLPYEYDQIKMKDILIFHTLMNAEAQRQKNEERKQQAKANMAQGRARMRRR